MKTKRKYFFPQKLRYKKYLKLPNVEFEYRYLVIFNCITFKDKLFSFRFHDDPLVIWVYKNDQIENVTSSIFPDILEKLRLKNSHQ
jgi:hypothetical protein